MDFVTHTWVWLRGNAQTIYYLLAAISIMAAAYTYRKNSTLERARWLSSLYSKFYETADLKAIREILDCSVANAFEVRKLVDEQDATFTDYLNFFEFMAYLRACASSRTKMWLPCSIITCGFSASTKTCENTFWTTGTATGT